MRAASFSIVLVVAASIGCQSESYERHRPTDRDYSIRSLDGWTERVHGEAVVFVGDPELGQERVTISIRDARLRASDVPDTSSTEVVLAGTRSVLEALPEVEMTTERTLRRSGFVGADYSLSFVPSGKQERYDRRHVVLVGERIYHVIHTAPAGQLVSTAAVFDEVVASLKEEA